MNAKDFLQRVLPDGTDYYGALLSSGGFHQHKLRSREDVVRYADKFRKKKCNIYFAVGSFTGQRTADDCTYKRALYIDLDCGPEKPYADKESGITSLISFCDSHFTRPNILVDSGNGIHAYWTFKNDITVESWLPMATALKELCEVHGLQADPTVTADAARILRIPGTFNQKGDTPREVRVLHATTNEFDPTELAALLGTKKSAALNTLATWAGESDLEFEPDYINTPYSATEIIKHCGVLQHTYKTGGADQVEPLWMAQLSLMAYTTDGSEYIHTLSEGHKDYDYRRTEKKYNQRLAVKEAGKYGPPLCKTLGMYLPEKCQACRFNGKIKSPIVLGREEDGNDLPFPYKQDDKAIYKAEKVKSDDGQQVEEMVKVISFPIEDFQLFASPDPKAGMVYRFTVTKFGTHPAEFTTQQLTDRSQLLVELSNSKIPLQASEYIGFQKLMTTWASKMILAKQVGQPTASLGWTKHDDKPAFTLIDRTIVQGSDDKEVTFLDKEFVKDFTPQGDREAWLKLSHYLTAEDRHAITAGILSAFASPLITFTGVNGCVLALVSDKSGTGKSTALRCAQSVWGDPRRGVNALDDTPLSVAHRMGKLNNLPAFWDELRMRDQVEKFVILMFQVSQGKERSRLTSQITSRHVGTWNTLITVASNESITDHVRHLVHGTDAGLLRVFEVTVPYLQRKKDIDADSAALDRNFGFIGREYAEWLVANHTRVTTLLEKVKQGFSKKVNADAAERFWVATCSALLTAAIVTNKLGYTSIDIDQFTRWLVSEFKRSREEQTMDFDPVEVRAKKYVLEFLDVHKDYLVVFDRLSNQGVKTVGPCYFADVRGEILGVYAIKDKKVRIKKAPFIKWVYEHHQEAHTKIIDALKDQGCMERKASVTTGLPNMVHNRVQVLDIPLDDNCFAEFIDSVHDHADAEPIFSET